MTVCVTEFASKSATGWRDELARLKRTGAADADDRVRECRAGLAFWKVRRAIEVAMANLSPAAIDQLVPVLMGLRR